ncbi:MAG: hypothetical protein GX971_05425 [Firmicutes bacterium]|nr:hypothetical protein [Bacillota bacterium]
MKLRILWLLPQESRKKIKKFLRFGDEFANNGEVELAQYCYDLSRELAEQAGTIHLLKKIEQRFQ